MVGVVSDPVFMNHDTGGYHPESPMRVHYVHTVFEPGDPGILMVDPVRADESDIRLVHSKGHLDRVRRACVPGRYVSLDPDTVCSKDSFDIALLAAGSLIRLVEMAVAGEIDCAFASVRPPGHHATPNEAMGFCLFNNVAVAAEKAIASLGVTRVLIVDFDVHHGNGTQDCFYSRKDVLYFSSHQYPFYPGTGGMHETGAEGARGYTVNCPLGARKGDGEFMALYERVLLPVMRAFEPGLVLVSAGFDAHAMDPIGGMQLSSRGFAALAGLILENARQAGAPVVFSLEGGYNLDALRDSVREVVEVMKGGQAPKVRPSGFRELDDICEVQARYWPV
ncbi:MAG TPA: histone deacetylase [Deltaproteobacteria bacterium]|mgnify:CR=1 FL=1|nr:histone deacetylase [Deltaproteobacteria bacterium]